MLRLATVIFVVMFVVGDHASYKRALLCHIVVNVLRVACDDFTCCIPTLGNPLCSTHFWGHILTQFNQNTLNSGVLLPTFWTMALGPPHVKLTLNKLFLQVGFFAR